VPVCLALTGFAGLNIVAQVGRGSFTVGRIFPASARQVSVSLGGGDITLRQTADSQARLTGTAHYSLIRPGITARASAGSAAFSFDCGDLPVGNCGLDSSLTVPRGTTVSVSTDGGSALVSGTTGDVAVSSGGGDVTADNVAGPLSLHTAGGNIQGDSITAADLTASTGGGDVTIVFTRVPRDVTVQTAGGNVTIVVPRGTAQYRVSASTAGGNVTDGTIPVNSSSRNEITATSGGGDITIRQAG
jgi:hypothetical protein